VKVDSWLPKATGKVEDLGNVFIRPLPLPRLMVPVVTVAVTIAAVCLVAAAVGLLIAAVRGDDGDGPIY